MRRSVLIGMGVALATAALLPGGVRAEERPVERVRLCTEPRVEEAIATVEGTLSSEQVPGRNGYRYSDSEYLYVLRLQKKQRVSLRVAGTKVTLRIASPSGRKLPTSAGDAAAFDGVADEAGDYTIRVGSGAGGAEQPWGFGHFQLDAEVRTLTESCTGAEVFERWVGKAPSDFFRGEPGVKARLRTLLKKDYGEFMERFQTTGQITKWRGAVLVEGFRTHLSTISSSLAIVDGKLNAALRDDGKVRSFSEDPAHPFSF